MGTLKWGRSLRGRLGDWVASSHHSLPASLRTRLPPVLRDSGRVQPAIMRAHGDRGT